MFIVQTVQKHWRLDTVKNVANSSRLCCKKGKIISLVNRSCTGATIETSGSSSVTNKTGGTPLAKVIVPPNKA